MGVDVTTKSAGKTQESESVLDGDAVGTKGPTRRPHPPAATASESTSPSATTGSWQPLTNQPSFAASTMLLLTDGTVMVIEANQGKKCWRLTPDSSGNYVAGTWTELASMNNGREYFPSAVLRDGRVIVAGGEYSDAGGDADKAEIFDPVANTWKTIGTPGWGHIGDASACLLPDGRWLVGDIMSPKTSIFDPVTEKWTATGEKASRCDEETWTLLPDGTVLTVETNNRPHAEKYVPSKGEWVSAGSTPVELVQSSSSEIGPAVLLPGGHALCIGATGHTALYEPPSHAADEGAWTTGPDFPQDGQKRLLKAKDAPATLLPSGNVLCAAGEAGEGAGEWPGSAEFFEYDTPTKSLVRVNDPGSAGNVLYHGRMLLLPTGQVLYAASVNAIYVYTPTGAPQATWSPTIVTAPTAVNPGGKGYSLTGTQLNGLSQACSYGDDAQMATNFPLVRLRDVSAGSMGELHYCRTYNHSTMGVATGSAVVSTTFDVPATVVPGQYELEVVANGIASAPKAVQVGHDMLWRFVGNTKGFGNLIDGKHPIWIGDFSGAGRAEVLFYYAGDSNWWLGTLTGGSIGWQLVGNTKGFGNLIDGQHPIWIGDFSGIHHVQTLFYYAGDSNWWLGTYV